MAALNNKILSDVIEEIKREVATRVKVYPQWIAAGKIDRPTAEHRYLCLMTAIKELEALQAQKVGSQSRLFDNPFEPKTPDFNAKD
jgi:hypothetical protein